MAVAEPYSAELRQRVVDAYEAGEGSYSVLAARFSVGEATVKRWVRRRRRLGHDEPDPKRGGTPSTIAAAEVETILSRLEDPTAAEATAEYNRGRRGRARVHVSSIKRALHRYGYVVKKNDAVRWSACARTSSTGE